MDPEAAHLRTLGLLERAAGYAGARAPSFSSRLAVSVAGLDFPNPLGLAAGCDKDARAVRAWPAMGFGFVEVGTVTSRPQPGNPKPRIFRLSADRAIINRLGFNGEGSEAVALRIARLRRGTDLRVPLGINIGKTKLAENVVEDYLASFHRLAPLADYVAVNVSSPNTPGLREWQERRHLTTLLAALQQAAQNLAETQASPPVPLFVKVAPDMSDAEMDDVVAAAFETGVAGIIATNTTIARGGALPESSESGGLSGAPLRERACAVIRYLYRRTEGSIPLVGVGGISTAADAYARVRAGAALVQLYTALIYEGPFLPRRINRGLLRLMDRDGVKRISDAVGTENSARS